MFLSMWYLNVDLKLHRSTGRTKSRNGTKHHEVKIRTEIEGEIQEHERKKECKKKKDS
jgi:hypothetical protein